jgi:hypothetical protein
LARDNPEIGDEMQVVGTEGATFAPVRFVIGERLSVVNFARALDIDDPLFTDLAHARAHGHRGRPVPPTMYAFFQTVTNADLEERLGFVWGKTLGAGLEFEVGATAGEEEVIVGQSSVETAWEAAGRGGGTRQFLRLRTDFRRPDGALVCRWRALFIQKRDTDPDPQAPHEPTVADPEPVPTPDHHLVPAPAASVGTALPSHHVGAVDRLRLARISVAIDNPDTLHLDDEVARAAGFPTVVGQGSGAAGVLYETVRRWAGTERVLGGSIRLTAPYGLGTELSSEGSVIEVAAHGGGRVAWCDVNLHDQDGGGIATGRFRVAL